MATAPFPLSSSVGYAIMGQHNAWIVSKDRAHPGDIVIMGKNGDPFDGFGADGHTAVIDALPGSPGVPDGHWRTMESWGRHGPGFNTRPISDWDMVVRVPGITAQRLQAMRELTTRCIANRIFYYAGPGDNDHDGIDNRADLNNYYDPTASLGVDCSGYVWALFDFAWSIQPGPPAMTAEQLAALIAFLLEVDVEHGLFVDSTTDAGGRAVDLDRWGSIFIENPAGGPHPKVNASKWAPNQDVFRKIYLTQVDKPIAGYAIDLNGVHFAWCEDGGVKPPNKNMGMAAGKIVGFPVGT